MKTITTYFVFVLSSFYISAQDQPEPDPKINRWELVLTSNAEFAHSDGERFHRGRSALQAGYHLNRVLVAGVESSVATNGKSITAQVYLKYRKSINDDFFWYVHGDAGYEWSTFSRRDYEFINNEFVVVSVREGRRDRFRSDVTIGFEYLFAQQWGALANVNFAEGVGIGVRYNF